MGSPNIILIYIIVVLERHTRSHKGLKIASISSDSSRNHRDIYLFRQVRSKRAGLSGRDRHGHRVHGFNVEQRDQGCSSVRGKIATLVQHPDQHRRRAQEQPRLPGGTARLEARLEEALVVDLSRQLIGTRVDPLLTAQKTLHCRTQS